MAKLDSIISDLRRRFSQSGFQVGQTIPKQKELARELGVSVVTIGEALHCLQEDGLITATRGKGTVISKPHFSASGRPAPYGVILTPALGNANHPTLTQPLALLQKACEASGRELRIFHGTSLLVSRAKLRTAMRDTAACFVIGATRPDFVQMIATLGKPVIFFGELYEGNCPPWAGQLTVNIEAISLMCLQFLRNFGHQNMLLVRAGGSCYAESLGAYFNRSAALLGCEETLQQLVVPEAPGDGSRIVKALRAEYPHVTAVIIDNGSRAGRVLQTLGKNNIRVPQEMSILAINGMNPDLLITPHLSRVENLTQRLGEKLLSMAEAMIDSGFILREQMTPNLIWGKTCQPLNKHSANRLLQARASNP